MGNLLAEILAGEYFINGTSVDPSVARRVLDPFIYRPSDSVVGALGVLRFVSYEFEEIVQRIPEGDDLIPNSLEVLPLEALDAIRGDDGYLVLPTDTSDTPEVMLFEFANMGDDVVLDAVATPFAPDGLDQLIGGLSNILGSPRRWMRRRRRRRCRPRANDLLCKSDHCEGKCRPYKKSDEHRVRTLCACCY
jgi:hypothetical protein